MFEAERRAFSLATDKVIEMPALSGLFHCRPADWVVSFEYHEHKSGKNSVCQHCPPDLRIGRRVRGKSIPGWGRGAGLSPREEGERPGFCPERRLRRAPQAVR